MLLPPLRALAALGLLGLRRSEMPVRVATGVAAPAARARGPADCERTRPIFEGSADELLPNPPPLLLPRSLPLLLRTIDHRGAEGGGAARGDRADAGGNSADGGRDALLFSLLLEPGAAVAAVAADAPCDGCEAFTGVLGACALVACTGTGEGERAARRYGGRPASGDGDRRPLARVARKRTG